MQSKKKSSKELCGKKDKLLSNIELNVEVWHKVFRVHYLQIVKNLVIYTL